MTDGDGATSAMTMRGASVGASVRHASASRQIITAFSNPDRLSKPVRFFSRYSQSRVNSALPPIMRMDAPRAAALRRHAAAAGMPGISSGSRKLCARPCRLAECVNCVKLQISLTSVSSDAPGFCSTCEIRLEIVPKQVETKRLNCPFDMPGTSSRHIAADSVCLNARPGRFISFTRCIIAGLFSSSATYCSNATSSSGF